MIVLLYTRSTTVDRNRCPGTNEHGRLNVYNTENQRLNNPVYENRTLFFKL